MTLKNKLKINRKGQFLPRDWLIALILFSGVIALGTVMVASQASDYGNLDIIDSSISQNFGDLQEATDIASLAFDATNRKGALTITGSFSILFQSAFTIIALIFNSVAIATGQLSSFGEFVGMPTAVSQILFPILISVLMVVLVFAIISTTTRREL